MIALLFIFCFSRDPLHTLCLGAILMYEMNEDVFVSACKAIYYLTADNGMEKIEVLLKCGEKDKQSKQF